MITQFRASTWAQTLCPASDDVVTNFLSGFTLRLKTDKLKEHARFSFPAFARPLKRNSGVDSLHLVNVSKEESEYTLELCLVWLPHALWSKCTSSFSWSEDAVRLFNVYVYEHEHRCPELLVQRILVFIVCWRPADGLTPRSLCRRLRFMSVSRWLIVQHNSVCTLWNMLGSRSHL